jgi:hypothetical protein
MDTPSRRSVRSHDRRGVVAALAVIVAVAAACSAAVASPTPTPAPTSQRSALPAGAYRSTAFHPQITFTLSDGWLMTGDAPGSFSLEPVASDQVGVHAFRSPLPGSQDADCPITPASGVGPTAADLVDWIRSRPGLSVGDPSPVSLGGFAGRQIDVRIVDGWTPSCPFAGGIPTVPLFVSPADPSFRWVVAGSERLRLFVLDVPGDGTVVVDIDAFDGSRMDDLLADATPIVQSMTFGLP